MRADAEFVWVLDPIDGTKNFISGIPLFGTLIGLAHRGRPVLGMIDQPVLRERWVGAAGRADRLNGSRFADAAPAPLSPTRRSIRPRPTCSRAPMQRGSQRLKRAVKLARFGADCYAYAQLASGFIDLVVERDLKPYDYFALVPVIEGAGGTVDRLGRTAARSRLRRAGDRLRRSRPARPRRDRSWPREPETAASCCHAAPISSRVAFTRGRLEGRGMASWIIDNPGAAGIAKAAPRGCRLCPAVAAAALPALAALGARAGPRGGRGAATASRSSAISNTGPISSISTTSTRTRPRAARSSTARSAPSTRSTRSP